VRVRMAALSDDAASCMAIALLPAPADECPLIRICAPLAPNRADLPRQVRVRSHFTSTVGFIGLSCCYELCTAACVCVEGGFYWP